MPFTLENLHFVKVFNLLFLLENGTVKYLNPLHTPGPASVETLIRHVYLPA